MKIKSIAAITLATLAINSVSAISLVSFEANKEGLGAQVNFEDFANGDVSPFAVALPGGATLSYNNAVIVQDNGNSSGAVPFPSTEGADDYLSIKKNGSATFDFNVAQTDLFAFQWGSIDSYNRIKFFLSNVLVGNFSGSDIVTSPVAANGNQGFNGSAYVAFGAGSYDKVVLSSSGNSFEIDNLSVLSVPDTGSSLALLGLSLGALALYRRRKA